MFSTEPKLDHAPIVSYVALSSIDTGHSKGVTGTDHLEVRDTNRGGERGEKDIVNCFACNMYIVHVHIASQFDLNLKIKKVLYLCTV